MSSFPYSESPAHPNALPRSPELMRRENTAVLVVDMQERFVPVINDFKTITWNIRRLLDASAALGVDVSATEQYPQGLGSTLEELSSRIPSQIPNKTTFSCGECGDIFDKWQQKGLSKALVCGIETHVCVQQTVFDLMAAGYQVFLPVDAVGSRFPMDREIALRRMESSGATLTTTESVMFEWCVRAGTDEFKKISSLAKEKLPK